MRTTKKLTLSAIFVALGAVILSLGAAIDVIDLTMGVVASLLVAFIFIEVGSPYTWLVWICTTLIMAMSFFAKPMWIEYFVLFGIYPILKGFIEKLPRGLWLLIKLLYINAVIWIMFFAFEKLLGVPFFEEELLIAKIALYVLINVAFIAYDKFITVAVKLYFLKLRPRFQRFLK